MDEPAQSPRVPVVEIATDDDLRRGLAQMLRRQNYGFNQEYRFPGGFIGFEAWKPEDPENTRVIITVTAGTADEGTIATALACLGWYRQQGSKPHARAWVIAKEFTAGAWYAAQACPDLTLKWYRVELSIDDAIGYTVKT
jgi:hypothetical protein